MKMNKKVLGLVLASMLSISVTGCGSNITERCLQEEQFIIKEQDDKQYSKVDIFKSTEYETLEDTEESNEKSIDVIIFSNEKYTIGFVEFLKYYRSFDESNQIGYTLNVKNTTGERIEVTIYGETAIKDGKKFDVNNDLNGSGYFEDERTYHYTFGESEAIKSTEDLLGVTFRIKITNHDNQTYDIIEVTIDEEGNVTTELVYEGFEQGVEKENNQTTEVKKVEKESVTIGEKNALKSAENYLNYMGFSKEGLRNQLEYDKYTTEEINYAVENVNVDWNEECRESAENYLNYMSFSKEGLRNQLEYEGYTKEQIDYAIEKVWE